MKLDQSSRVIDITNDDHNLIYDQIEEVANESCNKMDERHIELVSNITDLLQMLCIVVKEVRITFDQIPYSTVSQEEAGPS